MRNLEKLLTLPTGAIFSPRRTWRYMLWRRWDSTKPVITFIGLNPSTADEHKNDPTVRRCIGFAKERGYGGLIMANIFAYRATFPKDLLKAKDPIGPESDAYLKKYERVSERVVACWGNHGTFLNRGVRVVALFTRLYAFGRNKNGTPKHPLYLRRSLAPVPFR